MENVRSRRHRNLLLMLALLAIVMAASIIITSIRLYTIQIRESRTRSAESAAKLAADIVNGDRVNDWLENGQDEEYREQSAVLAALLNDTKDLIYLYVYQIRPDGCYVVFDFDVDSEYTTGAVGADAFGSKVDFDPTFMPYVPTLLEGGEIDVLESNDSFGWLLTKYSPVFDSNGRCVAYAGADVSMDELNDYMKHFIKIILLISACFFLGCIYIGARASMYYHKMDEIEENDRLHKREMELAVEEQKQMRLLFEQTASALATAIDAKDKYTHGHSRRVAEYSRKLASLAGKSEQECNDIYFAALLHDVGKIGIPGSIINKDGKLTDEEFAVIKTHPVIGGEILSSITQSPFLSIGARHHHERYDGRGYPEQLKGGDIPEFARIIAVADSYDAMSSKRSYRDPLPQQLVREEIVKGLEAQFDPVYGRLMIHLIDLDSEYEMKEHGEIKELAWTDKLHCGEYGEQHSEGLYIDRKVTALSLRSEPNEQSSGYDCLPTLLIFDSLDGRVHSSAGNRASLNYFEYCSVRLDGESECLGARKVEVSVKENLPLPAEEEFNKEKLVYEIQAVRNSDHVLVRINGKYRSAEVIAALPDTTRFAYLSLTGKHCDITNVSVEHAEEPVSESYIPRIAEEISYIKDAPEGDIPNLQVDGWRSASTKGIPVTDGMKISFHTVSLPTARLLWHCPYIVLFTSDDGTVNGVNYLEYSLTRYDGECWASSDFAKANASVSKTIDYIDWNAWKKQLKEGADCVITFKREGSRVTFATESGGLSLISVTEISGDFSELYVSLSGDQCAITDIKITDNA